MTPENQKFFEEAKDLFMVEGWSGFQEEISKIHSLVNNIETLDSQEAFWAAKGKLEILRYVMSYETLVDQMADEDENP